MDSHHQRPNGTQRMRSVKHEEHQILKASETDETLTELDLVKSLAETAVCDIACTVV